MADPAVGATERRSPTGIAAREGRETRTAPLNGAIQHSLLANHSPIQAPAGAPVERNRTRPNPQPESDAGTGEPRCPQRGRTTVHHLERARRDRRGRTLTGSGWRDPGRDRRRSDRHALACGQRTAHRPVTAWLPPSARTPPGAAAGGPGTADLRPVFPVGAGTAACRHGNADLRSARAGARNLRR